MQAQIFNKAIELFNGYKGLSLVSKAKSKTGQMIAKFSPFAGAEDKLVVIVSAEGAVKVLMHFANDEKTVLAQAASAEDAHAQYAATKHKQAADYAAKKAAEHNLPSLIGSDKQVIWALQIREEFRAECYAQMLGAEFDAVAKKQTGAAFWIDRRGDMSAIFSL